MDADYYVLKDYVVVFSVDCRQVLFRQTWAFPENVVSRNVCYGSGFLCGEGHLSIITSDVEVMNRSSRKETIIVFDSKGTVNSILFNADC